jgi:hypothetical protein
MPSSPDHNAPRPAPPRKEPKTGQAPRLRSLVEGAESRRADPRIPHRNGAGRVRKRRGQRADTLWTLRGHFGQVALGVGHPPDWPLARTNDQEANNSGRDPALRDGRPRPSPRPNGNDRSQPIRPWTSRLRSNKRKPSRSMLDTLNSSSPSRPAAPTPPSGARRAQPPVQRGPAHRLRTLVEGAESGRADP